MSEIKTAIVIPARLESTRLDRKLLTAMGGTTLIEQVHATCVASGIPTYIATDSEEIAALFPYNVIKTSANCRNGTERVAEAATHLGYDRYINVQGDMIGVSVPMIMNHANAAILERVNTSVTELYSNEITNPNVVKAIKTSEHAHWFTRKSVHYADKHLGIYSYSSNLLKRYAEVTNESTGEIAERLEQLRWIQTLDETIHLIYRPRVYERVYSIDSPEDIEKWKETNND